ncbi:hypothetical protein DSC45_06155 [Streptomyces sp. YIM 130001]|nr:hypothetical protein DSC45_06155 [Streptomyces sp. YIM 130001]
MGIDIAECVNQFLQFGRREPNLHGSGLLEIDRLMRDLEDHFKLVDAESDGTSR